MSETIIDAINTLPYEIANIVYSYMEPHPVALIVREHTDSECDRANEFCVKCEMYLSNYIVEVERVCRDWWGGKCEYCYAEEMGQEVYTCDDCGEKDFDPFFYLATNNGMFCSECMTNRDEYGEIIDEDN